MHTYRCSVLTEQAVKTRTGSVETMSIITMHTCSTLFLAHGSLSKSKNCHQTQKDDHCLIYTYNGQKQKKEILCSHSPLLVQAVLLWGGNSCRMFLWRLRQRRAHIHSGILRWRQASFWEEWGYALCLERLPFCIYKRACFSVNKGMDFN